MTGGKDEFDEREPAQSKTAAGTDGFLSAKAGTSETAIGGPVVAVRLEPGCGSSIEFRMSRYKNPPTLAQPWDRDWFGKN
jgi:hypothetical protein